MEGETKGIAELQVGIAAWRKARGQLNGRYEPASAALTLTLPAPPGSNLNSLGEFQIGGRSVYLDRRVPVHACSRPYSAIGVPG